MTPRAPAQHVARLGALPIRIERVPCTDYWWGTASLCTWRAGGEGQLNY